MPGSDAPRRRHDSEATTQRLLDAAAAAFVEHGSEKAVVSDIARRAGLTTGAIYARWPQKSDLMADAVDHLFKQILPEQRMADLGIANLPASEILEAWGVNLLSSDTIQDVLSQVFGSARNNAAVEERLQRFLNDQADQINRLVERGRGEAPEDSGFSTVAVTMLLQATGIGTHLLLSSGRDDRHVPSEQEWTELVVKLIDTLSSSPHQNDS